MQNFDASKEEENRAAYIALKADEVILQQIKMKQTFRCSFCLGFGHIVTDCATMKKINKMAEKGSEHQKIAWGKAKGRVVAERVKEASKMKLVGIQRGSMRAVVENLKKNGLGIKKN